MKQADMTEGEQLAMLKQQLCAQILLVPTGADNWIERAIHEAREVKERERTLGRLIRKLRDQVAGIPDEVDTAINLCKSAFCKNCWGEGKHKDGGRCCICHGTGKRPNAKDQG